LATAEKAPGALKTIGELSAELGVAQHILRYWEPRFPQLKPMQRAGNRRYYRPADVDLARRINRLLNEEGYTVRGVQKLLRDRGVQGEAPMMETPAAAPPAAAASQPEESREPPAEENGGVDVFRLIALRDRLQDALKD
jgi:DNA-binding transcriptional MerR regulator